MNEIVREIETTRIGERTVRRVLAKYEANVDIELEPAGGTTMLRDMRYQYLLPCGLLATSPIDGFIDRLRADVTRALAWDEEQNAWVPVEIRRRYPNE